MTFFVMLCYWHQFQHHITLVASLMAALHFLGHDDQNEVPHEFFGDVMPLAPVSASYDSDVCMYAI